jgi:uncharacterized protein
MRIKPSRRLTRWLIIIGAIYIVCGVALYFLQEKFLFHPQPLPADHVYTFQQPFKEINLPVSEEKNLSIIQFTVPDSVCKGVVLYFHGNRRNIERYAPFATNFTKHHYEVWMIDYPGFGKSTGTLSEETLYKDAAIFYKMANARFSSDSIIIYGKSIGTGIATYISSRTDCKRLILETPYYSIDALMNHYAFMYPVSAMTKYHLPSAAYMEKVDAPVSIFHGDDDEIIPYKNALRLVAAAKPGQAELITIKEGKHNNLNDFPLFHTKLDSLLQLP